MDFSLFKNKSISESSLLTVKKAAIKYGLDTSLLYH